MRWTAVATAVLVVAMVVPGTAWGQAPRVPATDLLPPVAPDEPAPDAAPVCGDHGLTCVRYVEAELADWEEHFGCDHRAVFPTVYRLLTREIRLVLEDDPGFFDDPAGVGLEALAFYELYEEMVTDHLAGRPIPEAWQVAMDAATSGDWTAGHDMLLAINAHVQRDMPFALERIGLVLPDGSSRKPDHDRGNEILDDAYVPIMQEVARRYDPMMGDVESVPVADDAGANQLVAGWREGVWRNAESLVTSTGTPTRATSEATIERNAATWAEAMRTGEVPGHREVRDAHCRAVLAERREADTDEPTERGGGGDAATEPGRTDPGTTTAAAAALPATGGGSIVGLVALAVGWSLRGRRHTRRAP